MLRDIKQKYNELIKTIPEAYKVKKRLYSPKSLNEYQIVSLMKLFSSNDKGDGMISYDTLYEILGKANLQFKTSNEEIDELLKFSFDDENDFLNSKRNGINFSTLLYIVDTLKREKLVLVYFKNSLNYVIFFLLILLLVLYLNLFYSKY